MIELEITVVFFTAIFFTLLYLIKAGDYTIGSISVGIIAFASWQTVSLMWLLIDPLSTGYSVALLFQVISILFLLSSILEIFKWLDIRRGYDVGEE